MKKAPSLLLGVILVAGCQSPAPEGGDLPPRPAGKVTEHADRYDLRQKEPPASFEEVGIQTSQCMAGKCPVYAIILQNTGTIYYHGQENVKKGYYIGYDANNVWLISDLLSTMDLNSYADVYTVDVSEQSGPLIYIKTSKGTKIIEDSSFLIPLKLRLLEELIIGSIRDVKLEKYNWAKKGRS